MISEISEFRIQSKLADFIERSRTMEIIKKRKIKISDLSLSNFEKIKARFQGFHGIRELSCKETKHELWITYDLEKVTLKEIMSGIVSLGLHPADGFWHRLKRNMLYDSEKNELDNLHAEPLPCCSNMDEILEKTKRKPDT